MQVTDMSLLLLRLGLCTEEICESTFSGVLLPDDARALDSFWREVYSFGVSQGVGAVQFDGLQKVVSSGFLPPRLLPFRSLRMQWLSHSLHVERNCASQYSLASELASIYSGHGIRTVVLKGIASGLNYPDSNRRPCGDLDCFLCGRYADGNLVASCLGAHVDTSVYVHSVINYKGLTVENHQFCTGIRGSSRARSFERLLQSLLRDEGTSMIGDTSLECPSALFNALYLTHHSHRHFLLEGGIALRHLCDWGMFVSRCGSEVDWDRFLSFCDEYGLVRFASSMTRLSRDVLGVSVPSSFSVGIDDEADAYLLHEILHGFESPSSESAWRHRLSLLLGISGNRRRYRMFSDESFLHDIWRLVYGFCFDRKPEL